MDSRINGKIEDTGRSLLVVIGSTPWMSPGIVEEVAAEKCRPGGHDA